MSGRSSALAPQPCPYPPTHSHHQHHTILVPHAILVPQEKRVLEYVALGDFQTAVGFLLASPPDRTTRYYRDALCTLGMAFACGLQQTALLAGPGGAGGLGSPRQPPPPSMLPAGSGSMMAGTPAGATSAAVASAVEESAARTLFVQAAKVITANAAAVGDTLLGVPLLCSTGAEAGGSTARYHRRPLVPPPLGLLRLRRRLYVCTRHRCS